MKRLLIAVNILALAIAMTGCEKVNEKVSDALKSSAAMKLTNEGRNLFIGIMQANVDRESAGLQNVWPRSSEDDGFIDDKDDIAGIQHKSATEYFNVLFDIKGDNPYVNDLEKSVAFIDDRSKWCVAQGVSDEMPDSVPVLISANFDCSALPRTWSGNESDGNKKIPISSMKGIGDSGIVVIYKGGKAEFLRQADVSLCAILGTVPIETLPKSWLAPYGTVNAR